MHINIALPAVTGLIGFVFAGILLLRFLRRHQPAFLVWAFGLLWYAIAAATEAIGGLYGWTADLYRAWYLTGAIGVAAYLGAGTAYLHPEPGFGALAVVCLMLASAPALAAGQIGAGLSGLVAAAVLTGVLNLRRPWFAHTLLVILVLASVAAAVRVITAPVDASLLPSGPDIVVSGQAFNAATRALTPSFNISGAALLLFGAIASAVHWWRTRTMPNRVASNVLIALGAFVPSLATGLTRFGITSVFFAGELIGLLCILAGFLLSGSSSSRPSDSPGGTN